MKYLLRLLVLVLLCSCSKEAIDTADAPEADRTPSYKISIDSLKRQAVGLGATFGDAATKGRTVRAGEAIRLNSILSTKGITRGIVDNPTDPTAYVVNFEDEAGFAILVDDRRLDNNVLAYSESGSVTSATDNQGLLLFMEDANSYMGLLADNLRYVDYVVEEMPEYPYNTHKPRRDGDPYDWGTDQGVKFVWRGVVREMAKFTPLLPVLWGQFAPYYMALPVGDGQFYPTGCVNTAVAMLMSYYRWPEHTDDAGIRYSVNWSSALSGDIVGGNIHHLISDIGHAMGTTYSLAGSNTGTSKVAPLLRSRGYNSGNPVAFDAKIARSELENKRPIFARGETKGAPSGHFWVIDGYIAKYASLLVTDYLTYDNSTRKVIQVGQRISGVGSLLSSPTIYWHCNWGWTGKNNGYFADFKTGQAYQFDYGDNDKNKHDYTYEKRMIYNIKPL